jgi:hypothetical protein
MATLQDFIGGGIPAGLLDQEQMQAAEQRAQNSALINTFFSVLQGSRGQPGQGRPGLGQIVGQAGPVGLQAYQQSFDKTLADALKGLQIQELRRKQEEAEKIRKLAPQVFQVTRAEPTTGPFDLGGMGPVPEQPITGVRVNRELLPALGALGPAGMEYASQVAQFEKSLRPERVTLKPGEQVIEPETGRVVAKVAPTPDKVDLGTHIAFYDPQNPARPIITLPKGKDPKDLTSTELQVGGQFNTQAAPFISLGQNYKKIETAAKNPSAAGDISLIFGYMKLLDPASVVREGEFATAQNAGNIPESIYGMYNRAIRGERLAPTIREDFLGQAKNLVRSQQEIYKQTIEPRFDSIVQSAKLNKQNVMFNPFAGIDLTQTQTPQPQTTKTEIPTIRQTMQSGVTSGIKIRRIGD